MTEWSNKKNIDFVEDYRSFPCLWMASSAVYKDRVKRSDCLQFLKNKYEMGTMEAALNKIKSLRLYFQWVHNEYMSKKKSGLKIETGVRVSILV
jgi:site-specific recombinase XerD